jgi:hypothetical protein
MRDCDQACCSERLSQSDNGPKGSGQYWLDEGAPGASGGPASDGLQCRRIDHRTGYPEQPVEFERRSAVHSCARDDRNSAQRDDPWEAA